MEQIKLRANTDTNRASLPRAVDLLRQVVQLIRMKPTHTIDRTNAGGSRDRFYEAKPEIGEDGLWIRGTEYNHIAKAGYTIRASCLEHADDREYLRFLLDKIGAQNISCNVELSRSDHLRA
ncbi:hypothetical protein PVAG01_05281 [Phlyctema vagabunda]|uniref:LAGLIDADG homing endonuclease n=1 Tax=Phlyctema vagabunda TaxID=108571 RepID=A0ABR4PJM9_9HELO